jgi:hypothetical protein
MKERVSAIWNQTSENKREGKLMDVGAAVEVLFGGPPKVMAVQLIARVGAHSLRGELAV